jgi:hypothetical protein
MKRMNLLIIVLAWLLCTANQCNKENCHKTITFVNNSSKEVYIHGGHYPDTLGFSSLFPNPYNQPDLYRVRSGETNINGMHSRSCLDSDVSQGRLIIYVFDAEVLATETWGTVGKYYMVLKTIRPTLEDMQRSNWMITFTGE